MQLPRLGRSRKAWSSILVPSTCMASIMSCFGRAGSRQLTSVTGPSNAPSNVPDYVIKYAPLVYLHPQEPYMPSDIGAQIFHSTPKLEFADLNGAPSSLNLENLDELNAFGNKGLNIYLTSKDDISKEPKWIQGVRPNADGKTENAKSCAVIVVDKGNGTVDAFYMYFYAFNYGGIVLGKNLGNHVGDWEHNMVRFQDGVPTAVWYSQHASGQSFKYSGLDKDASGLRPIAFSGNGSHAVYATTGLHNHDRPDVHPPRPGFVNDYTDAGALWDPIQSAYWYTWSPPGPPPAVSNYPPTRDVASLGYLQAYNATTSPIGWFYFKGRWGDFRYKQDDPRQDNLLGLAWKYDSGPDGPAFKTLQRQNVWPGDKGALLGKAIPRSNL